MDKNPQKQGADTGGQDSEHAVPEKVGSIQEPETKADASKLADTRSKKEPSASIHSVGLVDVLRSFVRTHRTGIIRVAGILLIMAIAIIVRFRGYWVAVGKDTLETWERVTDLSLASLLWTACFAGFCGIIRIAWFGGSSTMKGWRKVLSWLLKVGKEIGIIVCSAWAILFVFYTFLIAPPLMYESKVAELSKLEAGNAAYASEAERLQRRVKELSEDFDPSAAALKRRIQKLCLKIMEFRSQHEAAQSERSLLEARQHSQLGYGALTNRQLSQKRWEASVRERRNDDTKYINEFQDRFLGRVGNARDQLVDLGYESEDLNKAFGFFNLTDYRIDVMVRELQRLSSKIPDDPVTPP